MASEVAALLELTRVLALSASLEDTLQAIADRCVELVATPRVSIRLFDPSRTRLLATARAGGPLHRNATSPFSLGEGLIGWVAEHGAALLTNDAEADPRFVSRADMLDRMGSFLGVPVEAGGQCIGVISAVHPSKDAFTDAHEQVVRLVAGICAPYLEVARLSRLAQVDALTGAFNRRGLDVAFPQSRSHRNVAVVMIDIDHFKEVNDARGHAAGDECLRRVAEVLFEVVRAEDAVVRYAGDEFLLVMRDLDLLQATRIAERARAAVEAAALNVGDTTEHVTLSAGVAIQRHGEHRDDTIARADAALYRAKRDGRNRVVVAES